MRKGTKRNEWDCGMADIDGRVTVRELDDGRFEVYYFHYMTKRTDVLALFDTFDTARDWAWGEYRRRKAFLYGK